MCHVIAVWSCDQCSDHVTLNTESPGNPHPLLWGRHKWIRGPSYLTESPGNPHPLLWGRHKWIRGPSRARGAIGKYLTNDDLSRHCGTGERQKYDDLSRHSGTREVKLASIIFCDISPRQFWANEKSLNINMWRLTVINWKELFGNGHESSPPLSPVSHLKFEVID